LLYNRWEFGSSTPEELGIQYKVVFAYFTVTDTGIEYKKDGAVPYRDFVTICDVDEIHH